MVELAKLRRRDFLRLALAGGVALAVPLVGSRLASLASALPDGRAPFLKSVNAMGTTISFRVEDDIDQSSADGAVTSAVNEINRLERLLTRFPGGTDVCQLNLSGVLESPSPDVVAVIQKATAFSDGTQGSFDITVKPVLDLLQDYLNGQPFPTDAQFESARALIGYEWVSASANDASLSKTGMGVTLDGIAEGYILDRSVTVLRSLGIRSALVNVGGTIATIGSRANGDPWQVGIMDPVDTTRTIGTLQLRDQAVATSGDYENYFTPDRSYYHVIDPFTARSPLFSHSATVVADTAMEADPLGVALMVEEPAQGMKLADAFPSQCLVYTRGGDILTTSGMKGLMT